MKVYTSQYVPVLFTYVYAVVVSTDLIALGDTYNRLFNHQCDYQLSLA